MDIAYKAAVLLGAVLLVGSGIARRWIATSPARRERTLVLVGALAGATLLVLGSVGEVTAVVTRVLRGRFDLELSIDYLGATRHGQAVVARSVAAVPLALWAASPLRHARVDRVGFAAVSVALLAAISLVSHSGTMGVLGFAADLAHLVATVTWAGALLGLALMPVWSPGLPLRALLRDVSRLGLAAVGVLAVSGTYMSTLHLYGVEAVAATPYGRALTVKLALVVVVLTLAAANRWLFVPLLERFDHSGPLRRSVRVETLFLALVLVATAVVATREPAHAPTPASLSTPASGSAVGPEDDPPLGPPVEAPAGHGH